MNLKQTKKKLILYFTIIIAILILVFACVFFGTKYITSQELNKRQLLDFTRNLKIKQLHPKDINELHLPEYRKTLLDENIKVREKYNKIDYIHLDASNKILDYKINNYIPENFITSAITSDIGDIHSIGGKYYFQKIKTKNGIFIFFKEANYSIYELISDLLLILVFDLLFSLLFLWVAKKFIEKVFVPVEENIAYMENFVHSAGHELKTPLAVMDSNLQLMMYEKKFDPELFGEIKQEVQHMDNLINSLVNLSVISRNVQNEQINLQSLLEKIIDNFSTDIADKNISVDIDVAKSETISANSNYAFIFFSNIISNAIKYNNQDGTLEIIYKNNTLKITDSGVGIHKDNINRIFDTFYREDSVRTTSGTGIGLSLVKKIADIYQWKLKVESVKSKGTSFIIKFK